MKDPPIKGHGGKKKKIDSIETRRGSRFPGVPKSVIGFV
jgi:hypothetical protein